MGGQDDGIASSAVVEDFERHAGGVGVVDEAAAFADEY